MTSFQKTVKYIATALALFLAIGIIVTILNFLLALDFIDNDSNKITDEALTYNISSSIEEIDIDLSTADFDIIIDNDFKLVSNNEDINIKENFNKLTISEENSFWKFNLEKKQVELHIPENLFFEKVNISTAAGDVDIENITADKIEFELGAGDVSIKNITAFDKADINGGAGKITVENSTITDLDMDMGIGELILTSQLKGSCQFDQGIGNSEITLIGEADDYSVHIDKGIGSAYIDGKEATDNSVYGSGETVILFNCGIGNVKVNYSKN